MKKLILLIFWRLFVCDATPHDPPPVMVFNYGDIDPNVRIYHSAKISPELIKSVQKKKDIDAYYEWERNARKSKKKAVN